MHAISCFTTEVIMLKKIVPEAHRTADRHQKFYGLLLNLALSRINSTWFLIFLDFLGYKWCLLCEMLISCAFQRRVAPFQTGVGIRSSVLVPYQMQAHVLSHQTHGKGGGMWRARETKQSTLSVFSSQRGGGNHAKINVLLNSFLPTTQMTFKAECLGLNGMSCSR